MSIARFRVVGSKISLSEPVRTERAIRVGAGVLFVAAGAFKLLAAPGAFLSLLEQSHAPFPEQLLFAIPVLEIGGGLSLMARCLVRLFSALLAIDMFAAVVLVGLPGVRGSRVDGYAIGGEVWRLPLEFLLLAAVLWLAASPSRSRSRSGFQRSETHEAIST